MKKLPEAGEGQNVPPSPFRTCFMRRNANTLRLSTNFYLICTKHITIFK